MVLKRRFEWAFLLFLLFSPLVIISDVFSDELRIDSATIAGAAEEPATNNRSSGSGSGQLNIVVDERSISMAEVEEKDFYSKKISARADFYDLAPYIQYYHDATNVLTYEDVSAPAFDAAFISNQRNLLNLGLTNSTYWLKVRIEYPFINPKFPAEKRWLFELGRAQLDLAELHWTEEDGNHAMLAADVREPFSSRAIRHSNSVFPIVANLGKSKTYYLKVKNGNTIYMPVTLWSEEAFAEKAIVEEFLYGVFFGAMLAMLFYNMFMYFSVRDQSYLYYVLYVSGFTLFNFIELGHGITLFDSGHVTFSKWCQPFLLWFTWIMVIQFTRVFLRTRKNHIVMDFLLRLVSVIIVIHMIISLAIDRASTQIWLSVFSIFVMLMVAVVGFVSWRKGDESARFFFIAWLFGISGGVTYTLVLLSVFSISPMLVYSAPFGTLASSILLSFALAFRIKRMQSDALVANKRAMNQLDRFRAIFNNAIEGMYRMSIDGRFLSANPAMVNMLGFSSLNAMQTFGMEALKKCFDDPQVQFSKLAQAGQFQIEVSYLQPDGRSFWADHTAQLIRFADGTPSHIEGTFVNVTERKEKEIAEQEQDNERVQKEVAEASAAAKSTFLANMSHEIRTPLTAIIGYSETLSEPDIDQDEAQSSLDTVIRSSHHLLSLINDILDFSKIEAQRLEVESVAVDIFALMQDVKAYFALKARSQQLFFDINYHFPLPSHIVADPTRIKQILLNLCSNALKFTKEGGVTIEVHWQDTDQKMMFEVKDTGIGLTASQRDKLFQVYTQADTSTSRQFGGTGLGLVISKQLAELMGGTIFVTSEEGQGSCFTTVIGGGVAAESTWVSGASDIKVVSDIHHLNDVNVPKLKGRILFAEDNKDNQGLVALLLKDTGAEICLVRNGLEAIEKVSNESIDLVLMDMHMPVMSGIEATQTIRSMGYRLPIVALTASVLQDDVDEFTKKGCTEFLAKPIDRQLFYQTLERYLGVDVKKD